MLLKLALLITSLISIDAISINKAEIENINTSVNIIQYENAKSLNSANETKSKHVEFCIYTSNSMTKIIDPYYMDSDSSNNKIYFDNIEEYARYIGPNWFGVSYCGNNTIVNNVGEYFKVVENKNYDEQINLNK
ncbi:hypothetical protein H8356DRAFT_971023, partial [Neocallimastix lanati (nom. inval.)]